MPAAVKMCPDNVPLLCVNNVKGWVHSNHTKKKVFLFFFFSLFIRNTSLMSSVDCAKFLERHIAVLQFFK